MACVYNYMIIKGGRGIALTIRIRKIRKQL